MEITELSTHLQGQLVAVHPAYDDAFDGFAAPEVRGNPVARQAWAVDQVMKALQASQHLGIQAHATFSGALVWPYIYPWPQRPAGLIEAAFDELAKRWKPILDSADECGVDVCYEIHPGEDLHDGVTFEMFLDRLQGHSRCNMLYDPSHYVLQHLDYLDNIDIYHERIRMFHVKDAELNPTGRQGVYSGYQNWLDRAGRDAFIGGVHRMAARLDDHYELAAGAVTRIPGGHPEGYLEGFANLYTDAASAIYAARTGASAPENCLYPTVLDGLTGVAFVAAVVGSSKATGVWKSLDYESNQH